MHTFRHIYESVYSVLGPVLLVLISIVGLRLLAYWHSFLLHWRSYRQRTPVTTADLRRLVVPFVKVQITTRGSAGSTEVVLRGIRNVEALVDDAPDYYASFVSVEVTTESEDQARIIEDLYRGSPLPVSVLVLPKDYTTLQGTGFKARALHYTVEQRRRGWNRTQGRTFIVHFDEESVMVPSELRKLIAVLATTEKKILEGPIYYPLEYMDAAPICRAMEANRPVGCFECRHVMESGMPLHLHGSNLVVEEAFENALGWDIGCLDGQPFIAEDYMFGMSAYMEGGSEAFGWHGCVILEQPPFSFKSAFKQRSRWIFGVLQGVHKWVHHPEFQQLPRYDRVRLVYGTRFRVGCFAGGAVVGALAFVYLPLMIYRTAETLFDGRPSPTPWPVNAWIVLIGLMWFGSVVIGAWYNLADSDFAHRWSQILLAVMLAPVAGICESTAGFWSVVQWNLGHREAGWNPTPKTKQADLDLDWSSTTEENEGRSDAPVSLNV
jgi:Glycosyl transferase family group 2